MNIRFYLASEGNCFMAEIARMLAEGFLSLGHEASLEFDAEPPFLPYEGLLNVLVAPHELFPLFLEPKCRRSRLVRVATNCYCLNTEQPGSRWFEAAFRFASRCKGVFDINRQGVREFQLRGVPAVYVPLGYVPSLEARCAAEKDIDILFLGHSSPRRDRFLARHAPALSRYDCRLVLADADRPRRVATPGFFADAERNLLVRRSRILLNLHSSGRPYFEWHRALPAMANRCLLVSETSDDAHPLVPGEHLIFSDSDGLMARCEEYLADEVQRATIADRAYRFLKSQLRVEEGCRRMLDSTAGDCKVGRVAKLPGERRIGDLPHSERRIGNPPYEERRIGDLPHIGPLARLTRTAIGSLRSRYFLLRNLPAAVAPFLRRQPLAHLVFYPARSLLDRLRGKWSLEETERRRREIAGRLQQAATRGDADRGDQCEIVPNSRANAPCRRSFAFASDDGPRTQGPLRTDVRQNGPGPESTGCAASPDVSVVVTLYNYARFIGPCLGSVAASECEGLPNGFEVIVVDDASTDESAERAAESIERLSMPAYLARKRLNTGLADARNVGVRLARAPLVFTLDADNLIFPGCLSKLAAAIRRSNAAAAYGIIQKFEGRSSEGFELMSRYAWDPERLLASPYLDAMAMFDRGKLLAVGGYSTELICYGWFGWEDYDLWLKLAQAGHFCEFCPEIVAAYRVHGSSMIRATAHYKPRLVAYFREKFAGLAARYPLGPRRFGWATGTKGGEHVGQAFQPDITEMSGWKA